MTISILSSKHQTTLSAAIVKRLKLAPGTRLKQSVEGNRVILEPIQDVSTAFGAIKSKRRFRSIREETEETELAIGKEVARGRNA